MIRAVLFDFGGVIAEEGFRGGLRSIALKNGLDPDGFFATAEHAVYESGYVTGKAGEASYWNILRKKTGIRGSDEELRQEILCRFELRAGMLETVRDLKNRGLVVAILSDQTNWLSEVNDRQPFFHLFDRVFNSYTLGKSKREPGIFSMVCNTLGIVPGEALFVDDNPANVARARAEGLGAICFTDLAQFREELASLSHAQ